MTILKYTGCVKFLFFEIQIWNKVIVSILGVFTFLSLIANSFWLITKILVRTRFRPLSKLRTTSFSTKKWIYLVRNNSKPNRSRGVGSHFYSSARAKLKSINFLPFLECFHIKSQLLCGLQRSNLAFDQRKSPNFSWN